MFGIDIIDASLLPAMTVALLAGILSFLSPCVLPIVPPYLAYMSGISVGELRQGRSAVLASVFFVLGLSTVFLVLGAATSAFGLLFLAYKGWLETVAGIIVMVFGAHFIGVFRLRFLDRDVRFAAGDEWWLTLEEESQLDEWNARHRSYSMIADVLSIVVDWDLTDPAAFEKFTATELLERAQLNKPTNPQAKECAAILREHLGEPKRINGYMKWSVPIRSQHRDQVPSPRVQAALSE